MRNYSNAINPYIATYHAYPNTRPFPLVNPHMFMQSAKKLEAYLRDAQTLVHHISQSETFAKNLMSAAQQSKTNTVTVMVNQFLHTHPRITFTPTGLTLTFTDTTELQCCYVEMQMRWQ